MSLAQVFHLAYESHNLLAIVKEPQIVVDEINSKTTIYFAPGSDGSSSTITLDGVADTQGNLNIVFGSSIGDEPAP